MCPEGAIATDHSRQSVHVYIREDIKDAQYIKFDVFTESLLGLSPTRLKEWVSIIAQEKWHEEREMKKNLTAFCKAKSEAARYDPLCNIMNHALEMAHGSLPNVPDTYPVDDLYMKRNDPLAIRPIPEHGSLGTIRRPDAVLFRGRHADKLKRRKLAGSGVKVLPPVAQNVQQAAGSSVAATAQGPGDGVSTPPLPRRASSRIAARAAAESRVQAIPIPVAVAEDPPHTEDLATVDDQDIIVMKLDHDSGKTMVVRLGLRWVDVILNIEFKGRTQLLDMLAAFRQDRKDRKGVLVYNITDNTIQPPGTSKTKTTTRGSGRGRGRGGSRGRRRGRGTKQQVNYAPTGDIPTTGRKRRRAPEDDDLLHHIRQPDPPDTADHDGHLDRPETPGELSYGIKDASIQLGSYALETLACTYGTRLHCVNILIKNDRIYLWYYDACGFVYTESISVIEDFEKTVAVFVALGCSTPEQLGALPPDVIKPPEHAPYPANWPPENLRDFTVAIPHPAWQAETPPSPDVPKEILVTLQKSINAQYILTGRRTFLYTVKQIPELSQEELIVKFSYQVSTRPREHELIKVARKAGVGNLPTVHAWGDLWKMSDGVRKIFREKGYDFEDRTLRSIVYSKYLPLDTLIPKSAEFIPMMAYQLIRCIHQLRYKAKILHRDISCNNVMWELRGSRLYFVLIDFDMATIVSYRSNQSYKASSKHRTGTLAFMAVDLIEDAARAGDEGYVAVPHLLCHDYESVFWLSYWCMLVLLVVDEVARKKLLDIVRAWETRELSQIADTKTALRVSAPADKRIKLPQPAIDAHLHEWLVAWIGFWFQVDGILRPYKFQRYLAMINGEDVPYMEYETANGFITQDNLLAKLTNSVPDTSDQPLSEDLLNKLVGRTVETSSSEDDHREPEPGPAPAPAHPTAAKSPKAKRPSKANTTRRKGAPSKKANTAARKPRAARKVAASPKKMAVRKPRRANTPPDDGEENDTRRRLRPRK